MDDLIDRLKAVLDEAERVARAAAEFDYGVKDWADDGDPVNVHIALHDPDRELRMVAAHRKILDLHRSADDTHRHCIGCGTASGESGEEYVVEDANECPVVLALAEGYGIVPGSGRLHP